MRITLAQVNPTVGDIDGNLACVIETVRKVATETDLVVFPEMILLGYPPQDLVSRPETLKRIESAVNELCKFSEEFPEVGILVGAPAKSPDEGGREIVNAALLISNGSVIHTQAKSLLPTYDVFDEARYFQPAGEISTVAFKGEKLGITICEDAWTDRALWPGGAMYDRDPIEELVKWGATLLINISGSPFSAGKEELRYRLMAAHAKRHSLPFVFVNQVGGNDELLFDGRSLCLNRKGEVTTALKEFAEDVITVDTENPGEALEYQTLDEIDSIHRALVMGLTDYARKCGFTQAVVGLSGGIDSAVTAALAVSALGSENVVGVAMPSEFSSPGSLSDAQALAKNLDLKLHTVPIGKMYECITDSLVGQIDSTEISVTQENLQARIRGNIIMALANEFGYLPLSTGNKSELAVGYCTLYGDMSGGLAVLADVPKTRVYDLARHINREREKIPLSSITKPPSAELRPNQKDQDSLPEYEILDKLLAGYIEENRSVAELVTEGFDEQTVRWVVDKIHKNEYKRRQAAPGLRVTSKSFGTGRRMPIAAKYN